jgi:pyrroloquinoline quinone biosynthesis protein B
VGLLVLVLGSAAGGGVPQWNSSSLACELARSGDPRSPSRTQTGLAIGTGDGAWWLIDASPDLRAQISATSALHPHGSLRGSPIRGVILTGADVDKIAGLLTLREGHAFTLLATPTVLALLDESRIFGVLDPSIVVRSPLDLGRPVELAPDLRITPFAVPGKAPRFAEKASEPTWGSAEHTIGLLVEGGGRRVVHVPGCATPSSDVVARCAGADAVLFDGTLWSDDEMIRLGASRKSGRRMGHACIAGPEGTISAFAQAQVGRKIFIHLNNTNAALVADTLERAELERAGWEVAYDGMELAW